MTSKDLDMLFISRNIETAFYTYIQIGMHIYVDGSYLYMKGE